MKGVKYFLAVADHKAPPMPKYAGSWSYLKPVIVKMDVSECKKNDDGSYSVSEGTFLGFHPNSWLTDGYCYSNVSCPGDGPPRSAYRLKQFCSEEHGCGVSYPAKFPASFVAYDRRDRLAGSNDPKDGPPLRCWDSPVDAIFDSPSQFWVKKEHKRR